LSRESIHLLGFGNQAKAWALNLTDSGFDVTIWLRENSKSFTETQKYNLKSQTWKKHSSPLTLALLIPDDEQALFLKEHHLDIPAGSMILYAHGYAVSRFKLQELYPQFEHVLFAPKAIATELRNRFLLKKPVGGVYSLEFVSSTQKNKVEAYLKKCSVALGLSLGFFPTSFSDETTADLFSEQALLCSLIPYGVQNAFEILREKGVSKELAYLEIWAELELIVKALVEAGPEKFFSLISPNALIGSEKGQKLLINTDFKNHFRQLLHEIESGQFDQELKLTNVEKLRETIESRWKKSELSQTFRELQGSL
jgi:ketol-acid reductoisomerase